MPYVILAVVVGLFGLVGLFIIPWIGGAALIVALVIGILGVVVGGPAAAAAAEDNDADVPAVEAPHLPGPGNPESGVD